MTTYETLQKLIERPIDIKGPGIYALYCREDDKVYIGSSNEIRKRWLDHMSALRRNKHHNIYLQRVFNKYGEDSIELIALKNTTNNREELAYQESLSANLITRDLLLNTAAVVPYVPMDKETLDRIISKQKGVKRGPRDKESVIRSTESLKKTKNSLEWHLSRPKTHKYDIETIQNIRYYYKQGAIFKQLSEYFKIPFESIRQICLRKQWKTIPDIEAPTIITHFEKFKRTAVRKSRKITIEDVLTIRRELDEGESKKILAKKYNLSKNQIRLIGKRETWIHVK